ncbi:MAG: hypothetical protein ACLP81_07145 [Acidimicrobiales bacterium]
MATPTGGSVSERVWRWALRRGLGRVRAISEARSAEARDLAVKSNLNRGLCIELRCYMLDCRRHDDPLFRQAVESIKFRFLDGVYHDVPDSTPADIVLGTDTIGLAALRSGGAKVMHLYAGGRIVGPVHGKGPRLQDLLLVQTHQDEILGRFQERP